MANLVRAYEARRVANALAGDGGYPAAVRMLIEYAEYLDRQEARCAPLVEAMSAAMVHLVNGRNREAMAALSPALRAYREGGHDGE